MIPHFVKTGLGDNYLGSSHYSISHKKLFELTSDAGAIYRIDGTVLINRDIFDAYLERFHEPATGKGKEEMEDER